MFFWRVSYFPFSLSLLFFLIGAFLFFPFPPDPPDVHEAEGQGTPIRSRPRGRGALGLGGIEISRDSRSVQPVFRRSL